MHSNITRKNNVDLNDLYFLPMDLNKHIEVVYYWFQMEYAKFWGMQGMTLTETRNFYLEHIQSGHFQVFIGFNQDTPCILLETYDPNLDEIKDLYEVQPGDVGMHFFAAPNNNPISGFTLAWMQKVMFFLFEELKAKRVVVEPDISNDKIHIRNLDVGFIYAKAIQMKSKIGMLAFCRPSDFYRSLKDTHQRLNAYKYHPNPHYEEALSLISHHKEETAMLNQQESNSTSELTNKSIQVTAHLNPKVWQHVNRHLVRKAIAEFSHEQLFVPTAFGNQDEHGWTSYTLASDTGKRQYTFKAKKMALRHWRIEKTSIQCYEHDILVELDAITFIIDFKDTLAIPEDKLPIYLDEISSTLYGAAYKIENAKFNSTELADANYQEIEAAMTEGHPGFVANNGRLGFNAFDYRQYAPENGSPFHILWIAVKKDMSVHGCIPGLEYSDLIEQELGSAKLKEFQEKLSNRGLKQHNYIFMPVHPWQWFNKINIVFAAEIAKENIIALGASDDFYKAQQSIRTYFNITNTHKNYIKTSLSILNMGFMRGLSPYYMEGTPKINAYLNDLISKDPVLNDYGFSILREIAAVGYRNPYFEAACPKDNPCKKMLSALWRESPMQRLQEGESLMSMTALLHLDNNNLSLLVELIKKSGLTPSKWITQYLKAYLQPLLHCFYAYDLTFMPHGENLILVMKNYVPTKTIMKDIAEESAILNTDITLPEDIARLAVEVPEAYKILGLFIDVFDGYFRHMAHILEESDTMAEIDFWSLVANSVIEYQNAHPELKSKFASRDIFATDFLHSCLNRLQLKNNLQMVNLSDPASSLIMADPLPNPITSFAPSPTTKNKTSVHKTTQI